ncbi:1562_t:CDS:1, partial [Acaulospora colombiana]
GEEEEFKEDTHLSHLERIERKNRKNRSKESRGRLPVSARKRPARQND